MKFQIVTNSATCSGNSSNEFSAQVMQFWMWVRHFSWCWDWCWNRYWECSRIKVRFIKWSKDKQVNSETLNKISVMRTNNKDKRKHDKGVIVPILPAVPASCQGTSVRYKLTNMNLMLSSEWQQQMEKQKNKLLTKMQNYGNHLHNMTMTVSPSEKNRECWSQFIDQTTRSLMQITLHVKILMVCLQRGTCGNNCLWKPEKDNKTTLFVNTVNATESERNAFLRARASFFANLLDNLACMQDSKNDIVLNVMAAFEILNPLNAAKQKNNLCIQWWWSKKYTWQHLL